MKIIVVGDGKVGLTLTEQLSKEEHDIVVIDKNPTVLQNSQETFDVMVVPGNGASRLARSWRAGCRSGYRCYFCR